MHELSIASEIISIVEEEAKKKKARRINSITLEVGKLSGIVVECLEFAFPIVAKDTLAEEAILKIENIPLKIYCYRCRKEFQLDEVNFHCPQCKDGNIQITSGRELIIQKIEVE
jgi:hydrogenase nickel incorporation protein HypA/HybF